MIDGDEALHLARVLRLRPGDAVRVFDGRGCEWQGRVASIGRASATIALEGTVDPAAEPPVRVTLAAGILKGDQMDAIVRDATMLGAAAIIPVASAHVSVPPRAWRSGSAVERWRRVAIASAKQCGRAVVPEISPVTEFTALLEAPVFGPVIMCLEPGAAEGVADATGVGGDRPAAALVLVGPEGGWSAAEVRLARARGAVPLRLGPRTLRAQTVPTVALSALWTMWGW